MTERVQGNIEQRRRWWRFWRAVSHFVMNQRLAAMNLADAIILFRPTWRDRR